ncbi:hypothetical protein [Plebeiibacterium sediminum]|uniref:Uncharacterized protein n=1 Tax=Plebeiibacterium sediminum TaxID=2992112 RepID=A0AAE3SG86_9BACT|nr:hypothetical protein [Plebeiobacterium sediminum]MCW3787038.1 hypothetical protein [Plebeiobacterium sediminum]
MHYTKFTRKDFLYKLDEITAYSIREAEIRNAVSSYGYNQSRLNEGRRLWENLRLLYIEAQDKAKLKRSCHAEKKSMQKEIHKNYMKYLKLARIAFVDNIEAQESLMLLGVRARTYDKWFVQVSVFVNNLKSNSLYLKSMAEFGIKEKDLNGLKKQLVELNELSDKCVRVTAVVRMLNDKVKKETIEVQQWVSSYLKVARIALEDNPEVLSLLGIMGKS